MRGVAGEAAGGTLGNYSNRFLITHYPQPSRYGTKQEYAAVSAGLNDGAQQGIEDEAEQSALTEMRDLRSAGGSYRTIAAHIKNTRRIEISHQGVKRALARST